MSDNTLLKDDDCIENLPFPPVQIYGYKTIRLHPLHPLFKQHGKEILTNENRDTFDQTEESVQRSVELWGPSIGYVRSEFITYDLCKSAIESVDESICSIKPHLLTEEEYYALCLLSITKNGRNIDLIPKEVQSQDLCDAAMRSSCWAIRSCVNTFKTYENCLSAVKGNGQTLEHVTKVFIDEAMCLSAVQSKYTCLNYIPKEFLTKELCEEAVKANGENSKYVPEEYMSSKLGYLAITSPGPYDSSTSANMAGLNIQYIPAKYITREIILEAVRRWYPAYKTIPKECLTEDIKNAVYEVSPICIQYME